MSKPILNTYNHFSYQYSGSNHQHTYGEMAHSQIGLLEVLCDSYIFLNQNPAYTTLKNSLRQLCRRVCQKKNNAIENAFKYK